METRFETPTLIPLKVLLPLIILIEGFVSIAVEILTIRQLLPVVGGSVLVTSIIIGIFLLFLALGYQRGGKVLASPSLLRKNFFISAIWLGIGLSYLFVSLFFYFIEKKLGISSIYPLLIYLLLIIAPLTYLLGQTIPITMNMVKQNQSAGIIGGNTLSLSTIGSFFGATMTTLVLMFYLGVAWTVFTNYIFLIILVIALSQKSFATLITLILSVAISGIIYGININSESQLFVITNSYANYHILNSNNSPLQKDEKILAINEALSSHTDQYRKGFAYIEVIKKILFYDLKLRNANILVLGAGGFSLSAENTFDNDFTYVDIDSKIKNITQKYFMPLKNINFVVDDARHYLRSTDKQYQAIVVDVYSDLKSIPAHLLTQEYMFEILHRLKPDGVVIFNIIANPLLLDPYSKHIDNTIRSAFQNCMTVPGYYLNRAVNILYICSNTKNRNDSKIYSDNLNNSTMDSFYR